MLNLNVTPFLEQFCEIEKPQRNLLHFTNYKYIKKEGKKRGVICRTVKYIFLITRSYLPFQQLLHFVINFQSLISTTEVRGS